MNTEKAIIDHYTSGDLAEKVLTVTRRTAVNPDKLSVPELGVHDEFHIGGRRATEYFLGQLKLKPGMNVLDIGCGIGGAARFAVSTYDVKASGIDLTPEFIATAMTLNEASGMVGNPSFKTGSAHDLSFGDGVFDAAFTIHTAMNIADKAAMYREAARVLKAGAVFGIYDIMALEGGGALEFPVPWSSSPETSFLVLPNEVMALLDMTGFEVIHDESRREMALEIMRKTEGDGPAPVRKADFAQKAINLQRNLEAGRCAPHIVICRKR